MTQKWLYLLPYFFLRLKSNFSEFIYFLHAYHLFSEYLNKKNFQSRYFNMNYTQIHYLQLNNFLFQKIKVDQIFFF